jgi:hypothetical protein
MKPQPGQNQMMGRGGYGNMQDTMNQANFGRQIRRAGTSDMGGDMGGARANPMYQQMLQQQMGDQRQAMGRMSGGPGNMDPGALQQLIGRSREERNMRPVNDMPDLRRQNFQMPDKQALIAQMQGGMPGRPGIEGLGNINALMQQRLQGGMTGGGPGGMARPGGMNPYSQYLQQSGANPAMQNSVTAPVRPTGMEDTQPFAPRLRFNNPMQQGPANPMDAQRSRYQQALGGFRGFGRG